MNEKPMLISVSLACKIGLMPAAFIAMADYLGEYPILDVPKVSRQLGGDADERAEAVDGLNNFGLIKTLPGFPSIYEIDEKRLAELINENAQEV
jgi:hypothetical protein